MTHEKRTLHIIMWISLDRFGHFLWREVGNLTLAHDSYTPGRPSFDRDRCGWGCRLWACRVYADKRDEQSLVPSS